MSTSLGERGEMNVRIGDKVLDKGQVVSAGV